MNQQNPQQNTHVATQYFDAAQRFYANIEASPLSRPSGIAGLSPNDELEGFEVAYDTDANGVLSLKAALPIGDLAIKIKQGKMLVFQGNFGPAMYGYRLHLVEGKQVWSMTHRWTLQQYANPNSPPAYVDYLFELVGLMLTEVFADKELDFVSVLSGIGEAYTGRLTSPELAETYDGLAKELWELSQSEDRVSMTEDQIRAKVADCVSRLEAVLVKPSEASAA